MVAGSLGGFSEFSECEGGVCAWWIVEDSGWIVDG